MSPGTSDAGTIDSVESNDQDGASSDSNIISDENKIPFDSGDERTGILTANRVGGFLPRAVGVGPPKESQNDSDAVRDQGTLDSDDESDGEGTVTWTLSLSPTSMTLDTNIKDVSSLREVIEQLSLNVPSHSVVDSADHADDADDADTEESGPRVRRNNACFQPWRQGPGAWTPLGFGIGPKLKLPSILFNDYNLSLIRVDLVEECAKVYFKCFNLRSPLVDRGSYFAAYPLATAAATSVQNPLGAIIDSISLLQSAVCTVSALHTMQVHRRADPNLARNISMMFYFRARSLLEDVFDAEPSLETLQVILLISLHPCIIPRASEAYAYEHSSIFVALAIRMAHWMELHRLDDPSCDRWSHLKALPREKELHRRVWWHVVMSDTTTTSNEPSLPRISDTLEKVQVQYPSRLEHEDELAGLGVVYFAQLLRLFAIQKSRPFRGLYRERADTASKVTIDSLETDLRAWHNALPDYMRYDAKREPGQFTSDPDGALEHFRWMTVWMIAVDYHSLWISIHRLFLSSSFGQGPFSADLTADVAVDTAALGGLSRPESLPAADDDSDDLKVKSSRPRLTTATNEIHQRSLRIVIESAQTLTGLLALLTQRNGSCYFDFPAFTLAATTWLRCADTNITPANGKPTLPALARANLTRLHTMLCTTVEFSLKHEIFVNIANALEHWLRDLPPTPLGDPPIVADMEKVSEVWMTRFLASLEGAEERVGGVSGVGGVGKASSGGKAGLGGKASSGGKAGSGGTAGRGGKSARGGGGAVRGRGRGAVKGGAL